MGIDSRSSSRPHACALNIGSDFRTHGPCTATVRTGKEGSLPGRTDEDQDWLRWAGTPSCAVAPVAPRLIARRLAERTHEPHQVKKQTSELQREGAKHRAPLHTTIMRAMTRGVLRRHAVYNSPDVFHVSAGQHTEPSRPELTKRVASAREWVKLAT